MKRLFAFIIILGVSSQGLNAVPKKYYVRQDKNSPAAIEELHNLIDDMKYEATNQETEMRMLQEKLTTQETAVDSLWKQLNDANAVNKEKLRNAFEEIEAKLATLEGSSLKEIKNHLNDSKEVAAQQKQKIHSLEKIIEIQNQNIEHLQAALQALMDALQIKDVSVVTDDHYHSLASGAMYQVKAGDSLEKIARKNNTTVSKIKELNHLTGNNDLIIVGQKLRLPE